MEIPMPSLEQVSWLTVARLGETLSISCLSSQASGGDRLLSGHSGRARKSKSTAVGLQSPGCTLMESFCIEVLCWVCKAVLSCDCLVLHLPRLSSLGAESSLFCFGAV